MATNRDNLSVWKKADELIDRNTQEKTKKQGVTEAHSKERSISPSSSQDLPSTRVMVDGTAVFVDFTEEKPLPRFSQDEKGKYRLALPSNASPQQAEEFAKIYIRALAYWNHAFKRGRKPRIKKARTGTLENLTIEIAFTNASIDPRFSQKEKDHYLLSVHPFTSLALAQAYAYLFGTVELLKRKASYKTVSYRDFSVQLEFADLSAGEFSQNADGSYTLRMPKGTSYEQAEALVKDYYERNLSRRQQGQSKRAVNKPHYALPFILVTPEGETTVYLPTEDAQAEQAFLEKHQKRVENIVRFIAKEYQVSKNATEPIALLFDDLEIIARHKKIRTFRLHLSPHNTIEASIPLPLSFTKAFPIIVKSHDWASRVLAKVALSQQTKDSITVWGKVYKLDVRVSKELPAVQMQGDTVSVHLSKEGQESADLLSSWYVSLLEPQLKALLDEYLPKMGVKIRLCRITPMSSRWGSYSSKTGSISINARLIEFSPRCLRGVVIHELCHYFVKNHGPEFYKLLERFCPDWREIDNELKAKF